MKQFQLLEQPILDIQIEKIKMAFDPCIIKLKNRLPLSLIIPIALPIYGELNILWGMDFSTNMCFLYSYISAVDI